MPEKDPNLLKEPQIHKNEDLFPWDFIWAVAHEALKYFGQSQWVFHQVGCIMDGEKACG